MAYHLFLASTPFNVMVSSMVALDLPETDTAELWLIDQPPQQNAFMSRIHLWEKSPFFHIKTVSRQAKGIKDKINRSANLRRLQADMNLIAPDHLYTGNDRRIEFQWLMAHSEKKLTGHYIDDGTYTYIGRQTHWFSDQILDNALKKLSYGLWWQQPISIGASPWINIAHVAFPEKVVDALKTKDLLPLPDNLQDRRFLNLANLFESAMIGLNQLDALLILPHESVRSKTTEKRLLNALKRFRSPGIKSHPRSTSPLKVSTATIVEAGMPVEILLTQFDRDTVIIGDVSSALLTTRWLRPDLNVECYADAPSPLCNLMEALNIKVYYP